jgi:hypothetical protein
MAIPCSPVAAPCASHPRSRSDEGDETPEIVFVFDHYDALDVRGCPMLATRLHELYLQKPMVLQVPLVGGLGQSAAPPQIFVQMFTCMTIAHWL